MSYTHDASGPPTVADPETLGFDGKKLAATERLLNEYIDQRRIAGAVSLVARRGEIVQLLALGRADLETGTPMTLDTLFRIFSLTKPVTSVATLMLAERGDISLDDPVEDYIPAFRDTPVFVGEENGQLVTEPPRRSPTVSHLLTQTSGIAGTAMPPGEPLAALYRRARIGDEGQTLEETVDKLAEIPLLFHPGEQWRYGVSTDVLARVIEVASGMRFGDFLRKNVFEPLGMHDTGFTVPEDKQPRLATIYSTIPAGQLRPMRQTTRPTLQSGSSGLVSTVLDYFRFAQMLLDGGTFQGRRLLHPETVELMRQNHLPDDLLPYKMPWAHVTRYTQGCGFGFGVRVVMDVDEWGIPGSVGEYGWAGAANTYLWIDPKEQIVALLFTQTFPFMNTKLDSDFKRIVYESLES